MEQVIVPKELLDQLEEARLDLCLLLQELDHEGLSPFQRTSTLIELHGIINVMIKITRPKWPEYQSNEVKH